MTVKFINNMTDFENTHKTILAEIESDKVFAELIYDKVDSYLVINYEGKIIRDDSCKRDLGLESIKNCDKFILTKVIKYYIDSNIKDIIDKEAYYRYIK